MSCAYLQRGVDRARSVGCQVRRSDNSSVSVPTVKFNAINKLKWSRKTLTVNTDNTVCVSTKDLNEQWQRKILTAMHTPNTSAKEKEAFDSSVLDREFRMCKNHFKKEDYIPTGLLNRVQAQEGDVYSDSLCTVAERDLKNERSNGATLKLGAVPMTKEESRLDAIVRLDPRERAATRPPASPVRRRSRTSANLHNTPPRRRKEAKVEAERQQLEAALKAKTEEGHRKDVQIEDLRAEVLSLRQNVSRAEIKKEVLASNAPTSPFEDGLSLGFMKSSPYYSTDEQCRNYTGLPSWEFVEELHDLVKAHIPENDGVRQWGSKATAPSNERSLLSDKDKLFFTLFILWTGNYTRVASSLFKISTSTGSRYFITWVRLLAITLKREMPFPSRARINELMPDKMRRKLGNSRLRLVLDATEWFMQKPSGKAANGCTFSSYKHRNTAKFLVGVSPCGAAVYVSEAFPGSLSDVLFVEVCGVLYCLEKCDDVMADKGFTIHELLAAKGVGLVIPPKLYKNQHDFLIDEVKHTEMVANLRIHVERSMGRTKEWGILQRDLSVHHKDLASDIFLVCCLMGNFKVPLCGDDFYDSVSDEHTP